MGKAKAAPPPAAEAAPAAAEAAGAEAAAPAAAPPASPARLGSSSPRALAVSGSSKKRNRTRPKQIEQLLAWRLQQVQEDYQRVQAEHTVRAHKEAVLQELCTAMSMIQLCLGPGGPHAGQDSTAAPTAGGAASQRLATLLVQEGNLLQQLEEGERRLEERLQQQQQQQQRAPQRAGMLPRHPDAISPAHDPLYLCRRLIAPELEDVATTTARDLALLHRERIRGVGLQLQLVGMGSSTPEAASRAIEEELVGLLRKLTAGLVTGRRELLMEYCATSADTLQLPGPGQPPANPMKRAAEALHLLDLSPLQEQTIALMLPFWQHALAKLDAEMAQLRQQINAGVALADHDTSAAGQGSAAAPAAAAAAGAHPGTSNDSGTALLAHGEQLEEMAECARRLRALLHNTVLLNVMCYAWLLGQMTWLQLGRLYIATYPYTPLWYNVARAVRARWEELRAGEAEQQQTALLQQQEAAAAAAAADSPVAADGG